MPMSPRMKTVSITGMAFTFFALAVFELSRMMGLSGFQLWLFRGLLWLLGLVVAAQSPPICSVRQATVSQPSASARSSWRSIRRAPATMAKAPPTSSGDGPEGCADNRTVFTSGTL